MLRSSIIAVCFALLMGANAMAQSQEPPPQTPPVQSEQQPDRTVDDQKQTSGEARPAEPAAQPAQHKPGEQAQHASEEASEFATLFGRRFKITDLLLVLFTAGLFIATTFLWLATRDLVEDAKHNAERQLRAYVSLIQAAVLGLDFEKPLKAPEIKLIFKNSGQTPAYDFRSTGAVTFAAYPLTSVLKDDEKDRTDATVIGPGGEHSYNLFTAPVTQEMWNAFLSETAAYYVHGTYAYTDAFGHRRSGAYRFRYGGKAGLRVDRAMTIDGESANKSN
jgi:hypothetical protein